MKTLLHTLFINHWPRKVIAIILAAIIWLVINHSLTTTKNIDKVAVRIINIPQGKTVEGLQANGRLEKRINLTLVGNKNILDELTSYDIEVLIDAADKPDEWIASITKKNLVSLNPEIDISKGVSRVYNPNFIIRLTKLVTDKIAIIITKPIGEPPRGYQFMDVWPYRLTLNVSGPEEVVGKLKSKEQRITFNLNDISKAQLDALASAHTSPKGDVVSFFVPEQWKQISIPLLSDTPIEIDDPLGKALRIDFVRCNLLPIDRPIPVSLYFPPEYINTINPKNVTLQPGSLLQQSYGLNMISSQLYANGVDSLFLQTVKDMMQIVIIVAPETERSLLDWSIEFINPRLLEDCYVSSLMSDISDEDMRLLQPSLREEYLRNRFRSYMNRFQLFKADDSKFQLNIQLQDGNIRVEEAKGIVK